jgi:hypothetical protein
VRRTSGSSIENGGPFDASGGYSMLTSSSRVASLARWRRCDVARADVRRECDERGAVEDRVDRPRLVLRHAEEVAGDHRDRTRGVDDVLAAGHGRWDGAVLVEELLDRVLDELDPDHVMAATREVGEVLGLAAERDEDPAPVGEPVGVRDEVRVRCALVKADLLLLPPTDPEAAFHGCSQRSSHGAIVSA